MKQRIELLMNGRRIVAVEGEVLHAETFVHSWPGITKSTMLPSVLLAPIAENSISMVRALKQIKELLEIAEFPKDGIYDADASIDDIDTMLAAIK